MRLLLLFTTALLLSTPATGQNLAFDRPLNVICVEAHPDDCDAKMGGTLARYAELGHRVKVLSLTNGDAGHQSQGGGALGNRRRAEGRAAGQALGIDEYTVLDNHDAELIPTLEVRHQVIRAIRNWNADIVFALRPNDYHPDHRNAGIVVQDAAYLVIVPNVTPDTPPLDRNPVFFYMSDGFQKPNPFSPDVVVSIDATLDKKMRALASHESQMFEWLPWTTGNRTLEGVPTDPQERLDWLRARWASRTIPADWRASLARWYGQETAQNVQHAEAFELCEYGYQPRPEEIPVLFPMLPAR